MEINGYLDHLHALISLHPDQRVSDVAQALKGGSSFWANNVDKEIFNTKLKWAKRYYAASVSQSVMPSVRNYIRNQEAHHSKKTFKEECEEFMEKYGFDELYE